MQLKGEAAWLGTLPGSKRAAIFILCRSEDRKNANIIVQRVFVDEVVEIIPDKNKGVPTKTTMNIRQKGEELLYFVLELACMV
jgi:hypothetical protein